MKDQDLAFYQYLETLNTINEIDDKLLQLFNEYIASNQNFKYNKTYLNDSIEGFKLCISAFKEKSRMVKQFAETLSKKYFSLGDWVIIIDNIFVIDCDFKQLLLTEMINPHSNNETHYILKQQLNMFNLFSLNNKQIKVY